MMPLTPRKTARLGWLLVLTALAACRKPPDDPAQDLARVRFSTLIPGAGVDSIRDLAVDADGNTYLTGGTSSEDFPISEGAPKKRLAGRMDVFVTKLDPKGALVWSILLGGPGYDRAYGVRVCRNGDLIVGGRAGEGFPTTPGALQPGFAGDLDPNGPYGPQDGFLAKISGDGRRIVWATYFGGPGREVVRDLDLEPDGSIALVLNEVSRPFPWASADAPQPRHGGAHDSVVAKLAPDAQRVVFATHLGGSANDIATSIRCARNGDLVVAGSTFSDDFPVSAGAYATAPAGGEDAFVARYRGDGSGILFSTRLGGSAGDGVAGLHGLALGPQDEIWITGFTLSSDFPTTVEGSGKTYGGASRGGWEEDGDNFVARISGDGAQLLASAYLGGEACDQAEAIDVDEQGRVLIGGSTFSGAYPVTKHAFQERKHRGRDAAITVYAPDLGTLVFSTYLGGEGEDYFRAGAFAEDGTIVVAGTTRSTRWPLVAPAFRRLGAGDDGMVLRCAF